jgi:hypothetical protein
VVLEKKNEKGRSKEIKNKRTVELSGRERGVFF